MAKIQRFLAIEFLIIIIIGLICIVFDIARGDNMMNRNSIYYLGSILYGIIFLVKLTISSVKVLISPNSPK